MKKIHQENLDEKFVSRKQGFDGRLLKVMVDTVTLPNGRETTREIIAHPGAVCVVPVLEDGSIIFVKQYRYAVGSVLYELPAGKLDKPDEDPLDCAKRELPAGKLDKPDEDPLDCAKRELSEETGYTAKNWQKLTSIVTTPGFTDEVIHLYAATGLEKFNQHTDEDEFIDIAALKPAEVRAMLQNEEIFDAKTLSALCMMLLQNPQFI